MSDPYDYLLAAIHQGDPYAAIGEGPTSDFGWNSNDPFIEETLGFANAKLIIEVGSFHGASARFMASRLPADGVVVCVDTFCGDHEHWIHNRDLLYLQQGRANFYEVFMRTNKARHLQTKIVPLPMDSLSGARYLKHVMDQGQVASADLIYLDGGHEYETVSRDIASYLPLLRPGGYMLFDDYPRDGITRAVNEIKWPHKGVRSPDGTKLRIHV